MTTGTDLHPAYVAGTWKLDPAHGELTFTVRHLMITKVRGKFDRFDVTVVTSEDPYASTVEATIDVASVNTNQEQRDNHLRTSDFFLVEEHPTATFVSTSVAGTPDAFTVTGDLTLRGVTKTIVLNGEFDGTITDPYGNTRAGVSGKTVINRHDWGVSWNAALEAGGATLGDDVTLEFALELILQS